MAAAARPADANADRPARLDLADDVRPPCVALVPAVEMTYFGERFVERALNVARRGIVATLLLEDGAGERALCPAARCVELRRASGHRRPAPVRLFLALEPKTEI